MTSLDGLWYLAEEARRRAERSYHRTVDAHGEGHIERTLQKRVSRGRFRTLARRIRDCGAPYGAHALVRCDGGELLLVRHEGADLWVLPGGGVGGAETYREAAERELREEAGIEADFGGLAMLNRVELACGGYDTWGVLPVFAASAETTDPTVADPDDGISAARWFDPGALPADTRDREDVIAAAQAVP